MEDLVPVEGIVKRIFFIRSHKVMLDNDLAELYGVKTKILNKAVKRNIDRFPADFMFQLTMQETENLRFHFGTSSEGHGGRRYIFPMFLQNKVWPCFPVFYIANKLFKLILQLCGHLYCLGK